jgi:hypothetical protein
MRKTAIIAGLLVLSASTSVGCKSAPKLAWWKSSKTDETALAHAAPELPSDAAKKAEAGASTQVAGGSAAPFKPANTSGSTSVASKSSGGYPSTDAPPFTPNAVTQVAANATPTTNAPMTSGAAGPYDPAATPAPKSTPTAVATTGTDRYGLGSMTAGASSTASISAPTYGQPASGTSTTAPTYTPTTNLAGVASPYGTPAGGIAATGAPMSAVTTASAAPTYSPAPVTPVSTAAIQPYRPGGTSSYNVSVASLPPSSTSTSTSSTAGATGTTTPPTSTAPTAPASAAPSTGTNRYW